MKKYSCLLMALVLICQLALPISATNLSKDNLEQGKLEDICEFVGEIFPNLYNIKPNDAVYLGAKLSTYRLNSLGETESCDYDTYPVIVNDCVVSIVDVVEQNGDFQIICGVDYASELQQALEQQNEEAFAVIHNNVGVKTLFASGKSITLKEPLNQDNVIAFSNPNDENLEFSQIRKEKEIKISDKITNRATLQNSIPIIRVANDKDDCCAGMCWAACMAMMSNYYYGTSYNARTIHDRFGCLPNDYHTDEKNSIRALGMYPSGPFTNFTFLNVQDYIDTGVLLLLDLQRSGGAHNVVVQGYYLSGTTPNGAFYYTAPNSGGKISSFPESSSDTVYVTCGGYNYYVHCYIAAEE